jgi:hypothetical protein
LRRAGAKFEPHRLIGFGKIPNAAAARAWTVACAVQASLAVSA